MTEPLRVGGLRVAYGRRVVVEGLDLAPLEPGTLTALVGPNAAGKSTLLRGIAGLVPGTRGQVRLGERDLLALSIPERAKHLAYMPQGLPGGVALTVMETLVGALRAVPTPLAPDGRAAAARALEMLRRLEIESLALLGLDRLSGGQRQLVALAQALAREPSVVLLDEPTSALDLRHQLSVMELVQRTVRERGLIGMVVLHDLSLASRFADRVVALHAGAVQADGPADAVLTPDLLARVYGVGARVERCSRGTLLVLADAPLRAGAN
ncbi:ABC transporter ATP-binding protein [Muricoccus radiodurans]|uniref:ABC transporter ATP-binding protein n=1 Tax=Muricoccus radiodurans TaxID=2231721 RepID=UPI003CF9BB1B